MTTSVSANHLNAPPDDSPHSDRVSAIRNINPSPTYARKKKIINSRRFLSVLFHFSISEIHFTIHTHHAHKLTFCETINDYVTKQNKKKHRGKKRLAMWVVLIPQPCVNIYILHTYKSYQGPLSQNYHYHLYFHSTSSIASYIRCLTGQPRL